LLLLRFGSPFLQKISIEFALGALLLLDIDAGNVSSAKELNMMTFFVKIVVVYGGIFSGIPIKNEFSIIEAANTTLFLDYA